MRHRGQLIVLVVAAALACIATTADAAPKLPTPGTAAQVAALVAASPSVTTLPSNLLPPLSKAAADSPATYYPGAARGCTGVKACVFPDLKAKSIVVLFGDSHAEMWLPAIAPVTQAAHVKLILIWKPGCPAADVSVWEATTHAINKACNKFRSQSIAEIKALHPALVLLADRTSDIPGAGNKLTTNAEWQAGEETTIAELKATTTKVVVIGDITAFTVILPDCLAAYPSDVQKCAVPNPNPDTHQHFAAEAAAATAEDVPYINPQPWLCTATICSPVIGNMVAYWDNEHVSSTYAEYLSGVWATALKSYL